MRANCLFLTAGFFPSGGTENALLQKEECIATRYQQ